MAKTIDDVFNVCVHIKEEIATINQRCVDRGKTIEGHQKTLYGGDGRGGIVATVNKLNNQDANRKALLTKIIASVVSALLVSAILALFAIWKYSGT